METVNAGWAQQSRTRVCKILPVSESGTMDGHLPDRRSSRGLSSRGGRGHRYVSFVRLESRDQSLVRGGPNDLVELRPVVRHEADPVDAEVIHLPTIVGGAVHAVVDRQL